MRPDLTPISRFPDLEKPERDRLNQLLRLLILTTRGDILTRGATYLKRLAIGAAGTVLHSDGTDVEWATLQANEIAVEILSGADYDDVQDYINFFGNRTLLSGGTISSEGDGDAAMASCTAWCKITDSNTAVGKFFNFAGVGNITLTDLVTNFIYLYYNGGTPQVVVATSVLTHGFKQDYIFVAAVYRSGNTLHIHQSDNLGIAGVNRAHLHHLEEFYVHRASGMVTSSVGTRQLAVATGVLYAGLNRNTTNAFNTYTGDTFSYWYYDGNADPDAVWVEVAAQNAIDSANYNNVLTGLVAHSAAAKRGVHWVYMDNDGVHLHVVYGQEDYSTAQAELATVPSSLPPIVTGYCTLIAKIIVQKDQDTLYISYPWTEAFKTSLATDHGSLAGLGDDDHIQYVKDTEFTATEDILVGTGSGTFVKKTPAEIMAILSGEAAANFAMNSNKITGVTDPTANQDAATKKYIDDHAAAADPHTGYRLESADHTHQSAGAQAGKLDHGSALDGLTHDDHTQYRLEADTDYLDKTHLSQDFGVSSARLLNIIFTPIDGVVLQINDTASGPFTAKINGGPDATTVVYDGDSNEDLFNGLQSGATNGATFWGRMILHNTTRSNSRKIVSVNRATNTITTESSTDDWADNDDITTQSQTNATAGFFDLDLSDSVASTVHALLWNFEIKDVSNTYDGARTLMIHIYESYDIGRLFTLACGGPHQGSAAQVWVKIVSQKVTMRFRNTTDMGVWMTIAGYSEYADT